MGRSRRWAGGGVSGEGTAAAEAGARLRERRGGADIARKRKTRATPDKFRKRGVVPASE